MFKINNSYESDPSTGSSSLGNNDLTTTTTPTTPTTPTLNTEWDFRHGSALKDYLFPLESSNSTEYKTKKLSVPNRHRNRNYHQSNKVDRSMVNSSQESDFCGFTPSSAANAFFEKTLENSNIVDDDDADEIGAIEEQKTRYHNELDLGNDDDTTTTTTTALSGQRQLREKLCATISAEYGLEQTIASEEFSDQDIRCQIEMTKNEQQFKARADNAAVIDECNESYLTIEPTSSDEDENDASLFHLGSPPAMHKDHGETRATPTVTTAAAVAATTATITNFHSHCTLDEDSSNAVDNAISNERCTFGGSSTPKDLSFNGKLTNFQSSTTNAGESSFMSRSNNNNNNNSCSSGSGNNNTCQSDWHREKDLSTTMTNEKSNLELQLQLQLETSREHINERSPDLFSENGDFIETENEAAIQDDDIAAAADGATAEDDDDLGTDVSGINDSADIKTDDGTATTIPSDKHIEKTERALNKRIQALLSGIIPPPSVTFVQHDVPNLLSIYKRNIALMDVPASIACNNNKKRTDEPCDVADTIPAMPNELEHIEWPQLKRANAFGVHYNRTKYTDNIEIMYMKLVERNVGQETASAFTVGGMNDKAAAAKKKPIRKLMASPGNRLSHLARRRAIFSSATLQSQSSQPSGLSKLGQKTCVIDASKLSRKEKVATPKRRPLAHRRTPGRKTPSSLKKSGNKPPHMLPVAPKFGTATRETSKRALFLSPTQEEPSSQTAGVPANLSSSSGDISRRIEKSKRALFSPPRRLERSISNLSNSSSQHSSTSFGGASNNGANKATTIDRLTYFNRTNSDVSINLKRRLEPDDDNENMEPTQHRNKLQRTDHQTQYFSMQTSKMTKAASENSMYPNQQLSASHKQKLLWAVSTSLKKKSITSTNANFQKYAAILGKAVKRLYLESLATKAESTSATMLRLADRLVFWVLKGKSVDEIYLEEKERMGASKNVTKRPSGYVNRDEYLMRLEASNKLNTSTQSTGIGGSTSNLYSKSNENLNCSLSDQNRPTLTNSSSKSNVGTSVLRENHDSKSAQKSAQHLATASNISFSGRNQKNLSPYNDKTRSMTNLNKSSKLLAGGANSSILKVKRQISFDS